MKTAASTASDVVRASAFTRPFIPVRGEDDKPSGEYRQSSYDREDG